MPSTDPEIRDDLVNNPYLLWGLLREAAGILEVVADAADRAYRRDIGEEPPATGETATLRSAAAQVRAIADVWDRG